MMFQRTREFVSTTEKSGESGALVSMTELSQVIYDAGNGGTSAVAEAILRKFDVTRRINT